MAQGSLSNEFMAATLSALKEDIGEVSKFVAESKRMGIDVVTPDVITVKNNLVLMIKIKLYSL